MLKYGNKDFRNLQEQVLKNAQDIIELKGRPLLEIEIVDELPEEGQAGILYLVPVEDSEEGNLYEEFVWVNDAWEQVGSASIDLSNYATLDGDNEFTGDNTFADVVVGDIVTENITPVTSGDYNIGAAAKKYEAGYINTIHADWKVETPRLQSTTDEITVLSTADNATVYLYPDVDGKLALGKSNKRISTVYASGITNDYSALSIKGKSGISFTCDNGSDVKPSTDAQITLGTAASRWKTIHLSHYVSWGNNVLIGKDGSNRFYVTGSDGNTKIKVGVNETYFVQHVEPDSSNTYDLGRTGMYWRNAYLKNIIDGNGNSIATEDIALKSTSSASEVFAQGYLDKTNGNYLIDTSITGMPDAGVYMFIYGNAQTMFYLDSDLLLAVNSGYPLRVACPVLIKDGGGTVSGATGNMKIEKTNTTGVFKLTVASTISGAARTEYASDTQGWGFKIIKTGL